MTRTAVFSSASLVTSFFATGLHAAGVEFSRDIQPLFAEHCLECHGPDAAKGGLVLTTLMGATKALKSGEKGVVPGDIERSAVIARVTTSDLDDHMPPKEKKPLKPQEIELLKAWIKEGAKYDLHWAYKPVVRPKVPEVRGQRLSDQTSEKGNSIDRFVLTKLAEKNIAPSPEADAYTLIKRASYDLLGLPPQPELVARYLDGSHGGKGTHDPHLSPESYSSLLDELLHSQHFGERWGRHWLDAARYADSDGYEKDRPRPDAWRYRDWVIRAVNDDMPFDEFTIEQIAGDLLPDATPEQIVATAFHRQTLTNTEGGTDQEQFRNEAVMDRTETTGAVWLGLTVGCARCHSHKYDQISQKEYYQMFSFYNNGDEVTRQVPTSPETWAAYEKANGDAAKKLVPLQKKLDAAKAALPAKLPEWEKNVQARLAEARTTKAQAAFAPLAVSGVTAESKTKFKQLDDGSWLASGKTPKTDAYTLEIGAIGRPLTTLKIEVLPDASLDGKGPGRSQNGNFVLSEVKLLAGRTLAEAVEVPLHSPVADFEQKGFAAKDVLDGNAQSGWGVGGKAGAPHHLTLQLAEPLSLSRAPKLFLRLEQRYEKAVEHVIGRFRVLGSSDVTEASIAPAEVVKILGEEPKRRNPVVIKPLWEWMEKVDADVVAANRALEDAKAKLPKPPLMDARVIAQRTSSPRATHLLHRGDFLQPAEEVVPAVFSVLPPVKPSAAMQSPSRLDFARWLVSEENPLTPRVTVNAIWAKLFGEGLVKTTADFGVRGMPPTHPELLDWLAAEFMKQGWSRKKLLKLIMTSTTYKQASRNRVELADIDPKNELLWRQNRLRVEGEIVRDLYLAACGLLSPKVGGPSVFPPMPPDIAALSYAGNFSWKTSEGEDRYRRALYTFFKRTAPHPDLTTFDCPDANITNVKRTVSNTPLQALTTLNAEAFAEAAQAMGRRLLAESHKNDAERLTRAFQLCVVRPPADRELAALEKLLSESRAYYKAHPADAKEAVGKYAVKGIAPDENAAWVATSRIILNMDEFITRE
ncbi:MAG: PSD1 and planctomycete cytochrome C domain-containing protein [Verrucomicrobiaceae bacterium]|nr:PSD1 and planctomycete cytochrome C domain-containing protein [Verrucomicrobiaceae bacterium]